MYTFTSARYMARAGQRAALRSISPCQSTLVAVPHRLHVTGSRLLSSASSNKSDNTDNNKGQNEPPKQGRKWPHPIAILAVASIAYSGFHLLRNTRPAGATQPDQPKKNLALRPINDPAFKKGELTIVFVLGGPGSGKGTNCARLVEDFGFVHLAAGDLLRDEQERPGSEYGELIRHNIKEGLIVPKEVTIALLKNAMKRSNSKRFLIDGFPRAMDQALQFEDTVAEGTAVLYFECPEEEMLKRLLNRGTTSGRADDNIESIRKRFRTFHNTSYPVIKFYEHQNKVYKVSCMQPPDVVYAETKRIFVNLLEKSEGKSVVAKQ
ncbi:adenylate kinase-domain-containing protein [Syncephalis fuscata]|nr:adenylate kinase-domain-containing protein [Syncephalis fuscata]